MRLAFFLLLLANLLFFVWSAGYLGGQEEGREPQRLQSQLNPEKITVTPVAPAAEAPASPAAASGPLSAAPPSQACRRVESVAAKDAGVLQQSLQTAGFVVAVMPMDERSWWVNIPALPNKAAADKKAGELKAFGVTDFHVMQGDGGSFVISLGVFNDEAVATQFLQMLTKKGIKSARMDARTKTPAALRLELRGPTDLFKQRLPQLMSAAAGATTAECP